MALKCKHCGMVSYSSASAKNHRCPRQVTQFATGRRDGSSGTSTYGIANNLMPDFTSSDSQVYITFPYTPTREYVDVE